MVFPTRKTILKLWHVILLGSAVFLMVVALFLALSFGWRGTESVALVAKSHELMHETDQTVAETRDAGVELLGYLNSGSSLHVETLGEIDRRLSRTLASLREKVASNPEQSKRVDDLAAKVQQRMAAVRAALQAAQRGDTKEAFAISFGPSAIGNLMEIRGIQHAIEADESAVLDVRRASLKSEMLATLVTVVITSVIALLLVFNAFLIMRRALQSLEREADLLRAKEQAERADKEKSEFLANMSHEIRTPMNSVLGFCELLRGIVTTPKQRQYVEAINTSGKALLAMINDILDLSKIAAGKLDVDAKPVSMREIFHGVRMIFEPQASERGLKLDLSVDSSVPSTLVFDALRLRQILFNTIGNALKFTPRGSVTAKAWCELTQADETKVNLFLSVRDTGIGIPREHHEAIFEPFRQVSSGLNSPTGGTGLGLSITRRLAEMLNGTIRVKSMPGEGSEFLFVFKNVEIATTIPEQEKAPGTPEDLDQLRPSLILIADDVALNRDLLAGYFEGTRHRLLFASTGREALEAAKRFHPDVILMDIRMPDLDGKRALEEIRGHGELIAVPIVAVTASSLVSEESKLRGMFDGYVRKPFSRSTLYTELSKILPKTNALESAPPMLVPEASTDAGDPKEWRDLASWLVEQERDAWPSLSRTMGFRETEAFAQTLLTYAVKARCPVAREFGKKLLNEVQNFDIQGQERTMKSFPNIVRQVVDAVKGVNR